MSNQIVPQESEGRGEPRLTNEQKATLEDFYKRMPITKAAQVMRVNPKILRGAIERGELEYIWLPGSARESVTPAMLSDWVRDYCTHRKEQVPA